MYWVLPLGNYNKNVRFYYFIFISHLLIVHIVVYIVITLLNKKNIKT